MEKLPILVVPERPIVFLSKESASVGYIPSCCEFEYDNLTVDSPLPPEIARVFSVDTPVSKKFSSWSFWNEYGFINCELFTTCPQTLGWPSNLGPHEPFSMR